MLTKRASRILEATIQGFIDEGFPISSGWLCNHHDFGIKSAMIRSELEDLSDKGFLEQPHHSAGRVPSDLGYEFFVERILEGGTRQQSFDWAANLFDDHAWPDLLGRISSVLGIMSVAAAPDGIYKTGLEQLLENLEWDEPQTIKEIVRDFVNLESRLEDVSKILDAGDAPHVFIGKKSPLTKSEELSVVAGSYNDNGEKVILLAIGPKRMNYKKAIKLFSALGPLRQSSSEASGSASGGKNQHGRRK